MIVGRYKNTNQVSKGYVTPDQTPVLARDQTNMENTTSCIRPSRMA